MPKLQNRKDTESLEGLFHQNSRNEKQRKKRQLSSIGAETKSLIDIVKLGDYVISLSAVVKNEAEKVLEIKSESQNEKTIFKAEIDDVDFSFKPIILPSPSSGVSLNSIVVIFRNKEGLLFVKNYSKTLENLDSQALVGNQKTANNRKTVQHEITDIWDVKLCDRNPENFCFFAKTAEKIYLYSVKINAGKIKFIDYLEHQISEDYYIAVANNLAAVNKRFKRILLKGNDGKLHFGEIDKELTSFEIPGLNESEIKHISLYEIKLGLGRSDSKFMGLIHSGKKVHLVCFNERNQLFDKQHVLPNNVSKVLHVECLQFQQTQLSIIPITKVFVVFEDRDGKVQQITFKVEAKQTFFYHSEKVELLTASSPTREPTARAVRSTTISKPVGSATLQNTDTQNTFTQKTVKKLIRKVSNPPSTVTPVTSASTISDSGYQNQLGCLPTRCNATIPLNSTNNNTNYINNTDYHTNSIDYLSLGISISFFVLFAAVVVCGIICFCCKVCNKLRARRNNPEQDTTTPPLLLGDFPQGSISHTQIDHTLAGQESGL